MLHYKRLVAPSTCSWALDATDDVGKLILRWLDASDLSLSLMWLTGNPAQGKSVLAAYLIDHCLQDFGECLYFFCRHDHEATRSATVLLRSVAFRLAETRESVRTTYLDIKGKGISVSDMPALVLWERLFKDGVFQESEEPIWWIIDGFDELHRNDREELAQLISDISSLGGKLRLLVIGRPDRDTQDIFEAARTEVQTVRIDQKRTTEDIRSVVSAGVDCRLTSLSAESKEIVINTLVEKAGSVFLWAQLALDLICKARREDAIAAMLERLPSDKRMTSLYTIIVERLLNTLDEDDQRLACIIFTWTLYSLRPLSVAELRFVVESEVGAVIAFDRTIREFTGSLIDIDEEERIYSIHATVNDFFQSEDAGEFKVSHTTGDEEILTLSMRYLAGDTPNLPQQLHRSANGKPEPARLREEYPLLEYSAEYLFSHISESRHQASQVCEFLESARSLTWIEALGSFGKVDILAKSADAIKSTFLMAFKDENNEDAQMRKRLSQLAFDLERICGQVAESVTQYPRSIHDSLVAYFPTSCMVAKERSCQRVRWLTPDPESRDKWPALRAMRVDHQDLSLFDAGRDAEVFCFTPAGDHVVHVVFLNDENTPRIDVFVHETQAYQTVCVERLSLQAVSGLSGRAAREINVSCTNEGEFRILVMFTVESKHGSGSDFGAENEFGIMLCEYISVTPYQSGTWSMTAEIGPAHMNPRSRLTHQMVLQPRGRGILIPWQGEVLYWRDLDTAVCQILSTREDIRSVEFGEIDDVPVILCVCSSMHLYIFDLEGNKLVEKIPHSDLTSILKYVNVVTIVIDPLIKVIFIMANEPFVLHFKDGSEIMSLQDASGNVQRRSIEVASSKYYFQVWTGNRLRRRLVYTDSSAVKPHPFRRHCLFQTKTSSFAIVDDISDDRFQPLESNNGAIITTLDSTPIDDISRWQSVLSHEEQVSHRIRLYPSNFQLSPCGKYVAFTGCSEQLHGFYLGQKLDDICNCRDERSQVGIGDNTTERPAIAWLSRLSGTVQTVQFDEYGCVYVVGELDLGEYLLERFECSSGSPMGAIMVPLYFYPFTRFTIIATSQDDHDLIVHFPSGHFASVHFVSTFSPSNEVFETYAMNIFESTPSVASTYVRSGLIVFLDSYRWICSVGVTETDDDIQRLFLLPEELEAYTVADMHCTEQGLLTLTLTTNRTYQDKKLDGTRQFRNTFIWKFQFK